MVRRSARAPRARARSCSARGVPAGVDRRPRADGNRPWTRRAIRDRAYATTRHDVAARTRARGPGRLDDPRTRGWCTVRRRNRRRHVRIHGQVDRLFVVVPEANLLLRRRSARIALAGRHRVRARRKTDERVPTGGVALDGARPKLLRWLLRAQLDDDGDRLTGPVGDPALDAARAGLRRRRFCEPIVGWW